MSSHGTAPSVRDIIAAHSMRRLLEAYRTLAPLTIGGPASTSLENSPSQLASSHRPQGDPMALRKYAKYPWLLGPAFPQLLSTVARPTSPNKQLEDGRRRHASCDSLLQGPRRYQERQTSPSAPVLSTKDRESSSLIETTLEGRSISCFSVGGELRLCLTQILQLVLDSVSLGRIHQACDELQIFCSTCSSSQLAALKAARVLPLTAHQCGLITKSDAERLCSLLLNRPVPVTSSPGSSPPVSPPRSDPTQQQLKVQHKCFGNCVGIFHTQSYTTTTAQCIECTECNTVLSPQRFVSHAHEWAERQTCHWGFDSQNWAAYIQVSDEYPEEEREVLTKELEEIKKRFSHTKLKRKWIESEREEVKRSRSIDKPGQATERVGGGGEGFCRPEPGARRGSDGPVSSTDIRTSLAGLTEAAKGFDKLGAPLVDPRSLYLQWASGSVVPPIMFPSPYLHSLAQFHNLKALAAKSLLSASVQHSTSTAETIEESSNNSSSPAAPSNNNSMTTNNNMIFNNVNNNEDDGEEFVKLVKDCLTSAEISSKSKTGVLTVVNRLVNRLNQAQEEKSTADQQLKGMEDAMSRLEEELEKKDNELKELIKSEDGGKEEEKKDYESSSDGGIESGPDVDDNVSDK